MSKHFISLSVACNSEKCTGAFRKISGLSKGLKLTLLILSVSKKLHPILLPGAPTNQYLEAMKGNWLLCTEGVFYALTYHDFDGGKSITWAGGRVKPWKSRLFWSQTALASLFADSGPKKVSSFRGQPFQ